MTRSPSLTSSDGRTVTYERDGSARITGVTTHAGHLAYAWDGTFLTSVTDDDGVVLFSNVYDEAGRVIEQTSPFGRVTTYTYQVPGATVIADDRGVRQAMVHDGRGNLTAVVDVDGSAMRITYDDADRAVRVVSKSGAEWRYDFDEHTGHLLTRHDPDGLRQSWTWDELGRPLTDTDRAGAVTSFEYDGALRTPVPGRRSRRQHGDRRTRLRRTARHDHRCRRCRASSGMGRRRSAHEDHRRHGRRDDLRIRCRRPARPPRRPRRHRHRACTTSTVGSSSRERGDAVSTYLRTPAGRIRGGTEPGDLPWTATFGPHGAIESITDAMGSTARYRVRLAR